VIKNRGTQTANNVIVRGFHSKPAAGLLGPDDFVAFTTPQLSTGTLDPNNTEEKTVGPSNGRRMSTHMGTTVC
jgi:zinc metalloprotease ZmpB